MTSCRFDDPSPCSGSDWSTVSANLRTASSAACWPLLTDSSTCSDNSVGLSATGIFNPHATGGGGTSQPASQPKPAASTRAPEGTQAVPQPRPPCLVLTCVFHGKCRDTMPEKPEVPAR